MTDEAHTADGCTVFEFDPSDDGPTADLWVDETFENSYEDQRAYIDGDTYEAKEIIKFDWDVTHHDYESQTERWVVDVTALDILAEKLEEAGFTFDASTDDDRDGSALFDLHEYVEEGDDITVIYEQKNNEKLNEKTGEVVSVTHTSGYEDKPQINFRRHDDDHFMYVEFDKWGKEGLYTGGSKNPFVGAIRRVIVATDEDRGVLDEDDSDEEEDTESLAAMRERVKEA